MKLEEALKSSKFVDNRHKVSLNILYTSYWLKTHISNALKQHDITAEQYNVMRILKGKHPGQMCVKDIGSRMIEKSSNVPRIIDRLVTKKLVKRTISKEDKRETLISLTEKAITLLEHTKSIVEEMNHKLIGVTENEAAILNELLEKVRINEE